MLTPRQLFWIRLKKNAKEQLRVWKSVLDWSVWLYLVIPGLFIGGGLYREVLQEMPDWAMSLPWAKLYPILLLLLLLSGQVRIFVENADRLFLLQRPEWLQTLKRCGFGYTLAVKLVVVGLPFLLLLPFLLKAEGLTGLQLGLAYGYTIVIGMVMAIGIHMLQGKLTGWRKRSIQWIGLLLFIAVYLTPMLAWTYDTSLLGISLSAGIVALLIMLRFGIRSPINFEAEVKQESETRLRSTELLMSQVIEAKPLVRLKSPFLFRQSQRLFRKSDSGTILAEMRLKAFLRGMTNIRVWISFISASTVAVTLVPGPVALFLVAALSLLGSAWLQLQWKQWFAEAYILQFPWSPGSARKGAVISRFWLLLLPMLLWSAIAGYKLLGAQAAILAALLCFIIWGGISLFTLRKLVD
jgi:ABC-2 type transport system permease protein